MTACAHVRVRDGRAGERPPGPLRKAQPINPAASYPDLRRRLQQAGAFEREFGFYRLYAALILLLIAASTGALFVVESLPLLLLNAVLLAGLMVNVSYFFHDAGHRQIFEQPAHNDALMLAMGFLVGVSRSWWFDTLNRHHSFPNDLDLDPNTALPVLAFSEEQAHNRPAWLKAVTRYQAFYFLPLLCLEGIGVRISGLLHIFTGKARFPWWEGLGIVVHMLAFGAIVFAALPFAQAVLFIAVHQMVAGFYLGAIFAPNHKGMLVPDPAQPLDFVRRQVLSSRNILPNPLTDLLYGGLNYQIEHHLFPKIPRNKLRLARRVVQDYCREQQIAYHETGLWASYAEVLSYFHRMAAPLRGSRNKGSPLQSPAE